MRFPKIAKPILIAGLPGSVIALLLALGFVKSGLYNVGAASPHGRFTEWVTHETMIHSVKHHARAIQEPAQLSSQQIAAGFCQYEAHCAACHGAAGVSRENWVSGMEPAPPYLLDARERFSRAELFWIIRNGIKMTGMPAWKNEMSDAETWDVVAWLDASRRLAPETYSRWRAERRCGG